MKPRRARASLLAGLCALMFVAAAGTPALSAPSSETNVRLALLARDLGRLDEALARWVQASEEEGAGGFIWNQRGWACAALGRLPEARESFRKAGERSSTSADQAEAQLGLGMVARMSAQPRQAIAPLRNAMVQGPYIMAAASYETALAELEAGDKPAAMAYLRQCASLDPLNLECLKELALLHDSNGENREAWRAYRRLLALDPGDAEATRRVRRLQGRIAGDPEAASSGRRLSRPLLPPEPPPDEALPASSGTVRVALYTGPDGKSATAAAVSFIANSDFRIIAGSGETVQDGGKAGRLWEISFQPERGLVELRDESRNIRLASKQAFRIVPAGRQGSLILKAARFSDGDAGLDTGDRELRGGVEVLPAPSGFKLVNEAGIEEYLYGVVSAAMPQGSPGEAFQAQAVVSRSRTLWYQAHGSANPERADICDSAACQKYLGLSAETRAAADGVRATTGIILERDGAAALAPEHENCGGLTEDGSAAGEPGMEGLVSVSDGERPDPWQEAPDRLELWTHEYPPADRFCAAGGPSAPVESRWARILRADDLSARAGRVRPIGDVRLLRAVRRTATGRIRTLEVEGSRGSLILDGDKAISDILSPGSLRSTLFTVQPLMRGGKADRFILWGAGSGHGVGLCRAGAMELAARGWTWQAILKHYFPDLRIARPAAKPKTIPWKKKP